MIDLAMSFPTRLYRDDRHYNSNEIIAMAQCAQRAHGAQLTVDSGAIARNPVQWTEPAGKVLVSREPARRRLGH